MSQVDLKSISDGVYEGNIVTNNEPGFYEVHTVYEYEDGIKEDFVNLGFVLENGFVYTKNFKQEKIPKRQRP